MCLERALDLESRNSGSWTCSPTWDSALPYLSDHLVQHLDSSVERTELSGRTRIRSQLAEFPLRSDLSDLTDLLSIYLTCEDTAGRQLSESRKRTLTRKPGTLVLEFQLLKLPETKSLLLKPPTLWYFVKAA